MTKAKGKSRTINRWIMLNGLYILREEKAGEPCWTIYRDGRMDPISTHAKLIDAKTAVVHLEKRPPENVTP